MAIKNDLIKFDAVLSSFKLNKIEAGIRLVFDISDNNMDSFKDLIDWKDKALKLFIGLDPKQGKLVGTEEEPDEENPAGC
jgi:hypothetical protein